MNRRGVIMGLVGLAAAPVWADPAAARRPPTRPPPRPAPSGRALLLRAGLGDAQMSCATLNLATGHAGPAWQPDLMLPPASTLKTVTTLFALDRLGPAHRFATRVLRAGDVLVLAGGGDPTLDTDGLAALAADTARAVGDWRPARLVVWGGALPRLPEIAPGQAAHLAYNPALSGMILNFNRVHLGWRCETGCRLSLEARADGTSPRAYTVSAATRPGRGAFGHAVTDGVEHWDIPREFLGRQGSRWLPVRRPEAYAGDVFQTLCRAKGLVLPAPEVVEELPEGGEIARRDSPLLTEILRGMLEYSTNLTAEVVGLAASGGASLADSAARMADWVGMTTGGAAILADHSGLSVENRISAATLVRVLARPGAQATLQPLLNRDPLREVLGADARGDGSNGAPLVRAKTGTLNFVSCLAGYARNPDGVEQAFAVMVADGEKRARTSGQELPSGVLTWTRRAKEVQRDVVAAGLHDARMDLVSTSKVISEQ